MDYNIPDKFIEFKPRWYKGIDFDREASDLLDVLNHCNKENDI